MSAAVTAETDSGTSWIDSARLVAVTTTSSRTAGGAASAGVAAQSRRPPRIRPAGTWDMRRGMLIGRLPLLVRVARKLFPNLLADFLFWQLFLFGQVGAVSLRSSRIRP